MKILAIETSCDETAASILQVEKGRLSVLAHVVSSQVELHAKWGGVVPNLAAREHVRNIVPVIDEALTKGLCTPDDIDAIAVTEGPGLIPALLIGTTAAKTLALVWDKPLIGIHHLEGHIYANLLAPDTELRFPLLALIVSGGHTELVLMQDHFEYQVLGETEDDAAGEAFDKVAKMLGLPYPGGPIVERKARELGITNYELGIKFPRPKMDSDDYNFSFSGLKTAVLYFLQKHQPELENKNFVAAVCHEFQEAVVDVLIGKTERALTEYRPATLVIAGGVSANVRLREQMENMVQRHPSCQFLMPPFMYSLDNASMIGAAAALRFSKMNETEKITLRKNALSLEPNANLPLIENMYWKIPPKIKKKTEKNIGQRAM